MSCSVTNSGVALRLFLFFLVLSRWCSPFCVLVVAVAVIAAAVVVAVACAGLGMLAGLPGLSGHAGGKMLKT